MGRMLTAKAKSHLNRHKRWATRGGNCLMSCNSALQVHELTITCRKLHWYSTQAFVGTKSSPSDRLCLKHWKRKTSCKYPQGPVRRATILKAWKAAETWQDHETTPQSFIVLFYNVQACRDAWPYRHLGLFYHEWRLCISRLPFAASKGANCCLNGTCHRWHNNNLRFHLRLSLDVAFQGCCLLAAQSGVSRAAQV